MTWHLRKGARVALPCRHCGAAALSVPIRPGARAVPCPACGLRTVVTVARKGGRWLVRTEPR